MKNTSAWNNFIENCNTINSATDLAKFFELTLTPAEREKIAARYMILAELIHGTKPQREIAANLNVSIFNVTRGANQLKSASISDKKLIKAPKE